MSQKRIRDYGVIVGELPTGKLNKITDVKGVRVGHCTIDNEEHKTGVTVIMPCEDNIFANKMLASSFVWMVLVKLRAWSRLRNWEHWKHRLL